MFLNARQSSFETDRPKPRRDWNESAGGLGVKTLIEGYRSFPGEHCGSVAMRGLLRHYCGLELPEPAVFGLGSGKQMVRHAP